MTGERPLGACVWLRVLTGVKGQGLEPQRADLQRICQQREWQVIKVYEVEEPAFGKLPEWGAAHFGLMCTLGNKMKSAAVLPVSSN